MQFSAVTLAILLAPLIATETIKVDVGLDGLFYSPDNIAAPNGTVIEFHYHPMAHSVTQSSFAAPCTQLEGGINSGLVPVATSESPTIFSITIHNDQSPMWLYCAQTKKSHCQAGMSMVVNEPKNPAKSLYAYQALAKLTTVSTIGGAVSGGTLSNITSSGGYGSAAPSGVAVPSGSGGHGSGGSGSNSTVVAGKPTATASGIGGGATETGAPVVSGAASSGRVMNWALVLGSAAIVALVL